MLANAAAAALLAVTAHTAMRADAGPATLLAFAALAAMLANAAAAALLAVTAHTAMHTDAGSAALLASMALAAVHQRAIRRSNGRP